MDQRKGNLWAKVIGLVMIFCLGFAGKVFAFFPEEGELKQEEELKQEWYERIEVGITAAALVQGVLGVDEELGRDKNKGYGAAAMDLEFSGEFSETDRAYVLLGVGSGENPQDDVSSFSGIVDGPSSSNDWAFSEAWYEKEWPLEGGSFRLRFGMVDTTAEVDQNEYANDGAGQFMSPVFVNNPAVPWASSTFGLIASYETEMWSLTLAYEDSEEWENLFDYPFLVGQLAVSSQLLGLLGRPGNYRFYVWYHGEKYQKQDGDEDPAWGFGVSVDQEVAEGMGLFFRYGYIGEDLTDFGYRHALSGGVSLSGKLWGRAEDDELGIGVAMFSLKDTDNEWHIEVFYRYQVNEHLALTPNLQYTRNPGGVADSDFYVLSLRGVWEF